MFLNREDAGIRLAERLTDYKNQSGALVLALPRGGVVTGFEIAESLNLTIDILIVRKIGFPYQPELAIGAISETGTVFLNRNIISAYGISDDYVEKEISRQKEEITRRVLIYRKGKKISGFTNNTIILTDDGVATGATMKAAITAMKKERIRELVIALPVAPPETASELSKMADKFICLETPSDFESVGSYYNDFEQVSDEDVMGFLRKAQERNIVEKSKEAHGKA